MSHPGISDETHNSHWNGEHKEEWIKVDNDMVHISAKAMNIIWGNDHRFWEWVKLPANESCFEVGAELVQVNWIEVTMSLDFDKFTLLPSATYEIIYKLKFKVDAFGWHSCPLTFELITPDGKHSTITESLESHQKKRNEWIEIHGGEFSLPSDLRGIVKFGMHEVQTHWWKGGLIFEGVVIRPKLV